LREPAENWLCNYLIHSEVFLKLTMYIAATVILAPISCTDEKVSSRYRNLKYQTKNVYTKVLKKKHKHVI